MLQDGISGKYHRFTPAAWHLISQMDGESTLQAIWEGAVAHLGDEAPTQDETIQLLGQLHASDLLASDVLPNSGELFERYKRMERQKLRQKMMSPLAIRIPLIDPERFLQRFVGFVGPIFGAVGLIVWLIVVGNGILLAVQNWEGLTSNVADTVLTPANLVLVWLLFPLVKALHELGHGFATKVWGGEVHEIGIMLLVFMPVPYVDASSSSAFRERYKRVVVGAAGMLVEVFIAAIALFVWVNAEQGLVRAIAYNIILIAGVSTLLFNANPLLRFDGYYILADTLEMPNLAIRANRYIGYLIQRYVFGMRQAQSPASAPGEPGWLVFYAVASFLYRMFIMMVIALFVASEFFFIGVLIAIWALANVFVIPLVKHVIFIFSNPVVGRRRPRAIATFVGAVASIAIVFFLFPAPLSTNAQAVVWLPENSIVRAQTSCFIDEVLAPPGTWVEQGQPLITCTNEGLIADFAALGARKRELQTRYVNELREDRFRAAMTRVELDSVDSNLARAKERIEDLTINSPFSGELHVPQMADLQGRFVNKGAVLGYVIDPGPVIARAVVTQADVSLVRNRTERVEVLIPGGDFRTLEGEIRREVPGASEELPSVALGTSGGGQVPVDPREPDGLTAFEKIFQFDIALPEDYRTGHYGSRVLVRIEHGSEPIAIQLWWAIRQVFLEQFGV